MSISTNEAFFIGWMKKPPRSICSFLFFTSAIFGGGLCGLAFSLSIGVDDPGNGRFAGRQTLVGVIETNPYPLLRLPPESITNTPRVVLLSGVGKRGVQELVAPMENSLVEVTGTLIKRGNIDMLQLARRGLKEPGGDLDERISSYKPDSSISLGKWRLTGEICDGKCYQGAMRPGRGLSHKACANLCLEGGIPPVFVTNVPVAGNQFLLLADQKGNPLPEIYSDFTAILIEVEGEIEKRDDLLVFKVDLGKAKVM